MRRSLLPLLVLLLVAPVLADPYIDLGEYSIYDPRIIAVYSDEVLLSRAEIINLEGLGTYELTQDVPPANTFTEQYEFIVTDPATGEQKPLAPGRYQITLTARTTSPAAPEVINVAEFEILGLEISLVEPPRGMAPDAPYDILVSTDLQATCVWSFAGFYQQMEDFDESDGYSHRIHDKTYRGTLYVICTEPTGKETPGEFPIGYDMTSAELNISVLPAVVQDPRYKFAAIRIRSYETLTSGTRKDEPTVCWIDDVLIPGEDETDPTTFKSYHEHIIYYNTIEDEDRHTFTYEVECMNLAGRSSTGSAEVIVHLGAVSDIAVLAPGDISNRSSFSLIVKPAFPATMCTVNDNDGDGQPRMTQGQNGTYSSSFSNLPQGENPFAIHCEGMRTADRDYTVTVDTFPPSLTEIKNVECSSNFKARLTSDDNGTGVAYYNYTIRDSSGILATGLTIAARINVGVPRTLNGSVRWSAFAVDLAGNKGAVGNASCEDDLCVNGIKDLGEQGVDCGGACVACVSCTNGTQCTTGTCNTGTCEPPDPLLCVNGIKDLGEEATDCGGSCPACVDCTTDVDCPTGVCGIEDVCVLPPPTGCTTGSQCISGVCEEGVCVPVDIGPHCSDDLECDPGEICDLGVCTPEVIPGCFSSTECDPGQECVAGSCRMVSTPPPPPPEAKGFDWLALILTLLGLIIMGGAGYFLWQQNEEKRVNTPPPVMTPPPVQRQVSPQEQARSIVEKKQREASKRDDRKEALSAFGGRAPESPLLKRRIRPGMRPPAGKQSEPERDEEFVELEDIDRKSKKPPAKDDKKKGKGDDEVFDALDKL